MPASALHHFRTPCTPDSCLLMSWSSRHRYRTPFRRGNKANTGPCGAVSQSDLLSDDSIIRSWKPWKEARLSISGVGWDSDVNARERPQRQSQDCWFSITAAVTHLWVGKHVYQRKSQADWIIPQVEGFYIECLSKEPPGLCLRHTRHWLGLRAHSFPFQQKSRRWGDSRSLWQSIEHLA